MKIFKFSFNVGVFKALSIYITNTNYWNLSHHFKNVLPESPFAASLASLLISMYLFFLSIGTY